MQLLSMSTQQIRAFCNLLIELDLDLNVLNTRRNKPQKIPIYYPVMVSSIIPFKRLYFSLKVGKNRRETSEIYVKNRSGLNTKLKADWLKLWRLVYRPDLQAENGRYSPWSRGWFVAAPGCRPQSELWTLQSLKG